MLRLVKEAQIQEIKRRKDPQSWKKKGPHIHMFFSETYDRLEKQNPERKVSESMLKQELVTSGNFTAGEAAQIINDMVSHGNIQKLGFDVLRKNSHSEMSKNEQK